MNKDWNERNNLNYINDYTFYLIEKTRQLAEFYRGVQIAQGQCLAGAWLFPA